MHIRITNADISRISNHLGMKHKEFITSYLQRMRMVTTTSRQAHHVLRGHERLCARGRGRRIPDQLAFRWREGQSASNTLRTRRALVKWQCAVEESAHEREQPADYDPLPKWEKLPIRVREAIPTCITTADAMA